MGDLGDDGSIVYVGAQGLYRVPASGGEGALVAAADGEGPGSQLWHPHMLPGSGTLLFAGGPNTEDLTRFGVFALDLETGERTPLLPDAMDPHYVDTGHLLFMRQGNLMAVRFDADQLAVIGEPVLMLEDVMQAVGMPNASHESGDGQVAVSTSGHLAYASGGVFPLRPRVIERATTEGLAGALDVDPRQFISVRASPGGERLAFAGQIGRATNVYIHDLARRVTERLNTGGFSSRAPEWDPTGRFIAFDSDREDGVSNIYRMAADGSSEPERLAPSARPQDVMSWSADGVIAYVQDGDIWMLPPDGEPTLFFASDAWETQVTFSPDGRWVAYESPQSGRAEVFVRPYPGPGPATLVSDDGGSHPAWSRDGTKIYFLDRPRLLVKDVLPGNEFRLGSARTFLDSWPFRFTTPQRSHDVLEDGSIIGPVGVEGAGLATRQRYRVDRIHLVLNFSEELRTRVPN